MRGCENTIRNSKNKWSRSIWTRNAVASIAREIGVNENTIHKWKAELIQKDGESDKEKLSMRKRIIELEMECEILKKAAIIFGRRS